MATHGHTDTVQLGDIVKMFYSKIQIIMGLKRKKQKRTVEIVSLSPGENGKMPANR